MPETVTVPGLPAMVTVARYAVRVLLAGHPCIGDAELIVSEAVTNSVRYSRSREADGAVRVSVEAKPGLVRIEITDDGPCWGIPTNTQAEALAEYGRGLMIVDSLATRWGQDEGRGYATLWAELECEA